MRRRPQWQVLLDGCNKALLFIAFSIFSVSGLWCRHATATILIEYLESTLEKSKWFRRLSSMCTYEGAPKSDLCKDGIANMKLGLHTLSTFLLLTDLWNLNLVAQRLNREQGISLQRQRGGMRSVLSAFA